jgi:hypothetical protein
METYRESVPHLLKQGQTMYLSSSYEKLKSEHFPIMTGIATLIQHLGGNKISIKSLTNRTHQAEEEPLRQYSNAKQTKILPENLDRSKDKEIIGSKTPRDLISPPDKPKTSLKVGEFFPLFSNSTPPWHDNGVDNDEVDDDNEPGIYSKILDGTEDGAHYIIASFVKNNNKIKDQLLTHFKYFLKLMCENIEGLKIHPVNTEWKLPILTSASDGNIPTTDTKIRDYFFVHNEFSLIPGTKNKPKVPLQKVDLNGCLQFGENRVYDGPDRITGIMSILAPCNVRQAIGNLLIELEGDVHQIRYKPAQRKKTRRRKYFQEFLLVYVPTELCNMYGMVWRSARKHCATLRNSSSRPTWTHTTKTFPSWMDISNR